MNAFTALAVKVVGGGAAAAVLSVGIATSLAQAASPSPSSPSSNTAAQNPDDRKADRRAVRAAVLEAEADVLGLKPEDLRKDLKAGQKVSDLAKAKGLDKAQFSLRLLAALRPRLEQLVDHKQITRRQMDRVILRIATGHIPWWDGAHHRK